MRVLHVLPTLDPGGAERLVLEHARRTPDVSIATVFGGGSLEVTGPIVQGERRKCRPSKQAFWRLVAAARGADVVHTHLFAGDLWGGLAAKLAGRPHVSHEHNVDRDEGAFTRAARRVSGAWPVATIAVSEAAARHSFARDIHVVENGVDLSRFTAPWGGGGGVLAVGRRVPQKGFDVLLAALPEGVHAQIAGEGPYSPAHPRVTWLGRREDLPRLLAAADVLVVPSRWEGFGLAALEGLAAGTPVIASAVDGLPALLGDAGILVPPDDSVQLRAALTRLLADPELRAELSARGPARAAQFTIERTFAGWAAAYARALKASPPAVTGG